MKPGNKGRGRLIRLLLLLLCAGAILAAHNNSLTSVNFSNIQSANWFADDSANPPVDVPKPPLPARVVEKSPALPTDAVLSPQPAAAGPAFSFAYMSLNESVQAQRSRCTDFFAAARSPYALSDIAGG